MLKIKRWIRRKISRNPEETSPTAEKQKSKRSCDVIKEYQENKTFTDAEIIVTGNDGEEVPFAIHRVIMCGCSPYLRELLTQEVNEANEVRIPEVSPEMMQWVVDFAYTNEVQIDDENVRDVLSVADRFDLSDLVEFCCAFLEGNLTVKNCLGFRQLANDYSCLELWNAATQFALFNFVKLAIESEEVLDLEASDLVTLLSDDELNTKNEGLVLELIDKWVSKDEDDRIGYITDLINTVRVYLVPPEILETSFLEYAQRSNPVLEEMICKIEARDTDLLNNRPRVNHEVLFVIGGWSSCNQSATNHVETYDIRADEWLQCHFAQDSVFRAYHGCAALDGQIYVIGGYARDKYYNSVRCFNPASKTWNEVAPMIYNRCCLSVAVVGGYIYAMGGLDNSKRLNTVERYSPTTNEWSLVHPMYQKRSSAGGASLNDRVYVVGGFNEKACLNSAEVYDPLDDHCEFEIGDKERRKKGESEAVKHHLRSAEKYDPVTCQWTSIAEMSNARSNFAIEVLDNLLFAIGGLRTWRTAECYDDTNNKWNYVSGMNLHKSGMGAVVIDVPNHLDYLPISRTNLANGNED